MGYRHTFVSEDNGDIYFPEWFTGKWSGAVHFGTYEGKACLPISSKQELKLHGAWSDFLDDLQNVLTELEAAAVSRGYNLGHGGISIRLAWLGEDLGDLREMVVTSKGRSTVQKESA